VNELWLPILIASLAGSLHCAAMCGSFVAAVTGLDPAERSGTRLHVAYHLGRLSTYLGLGAAAGGLGGALDWAGDRAGLGRVSALFAGALLIAWGVSELFASRGLVSLRRRAPRRAGVWLGAALARIRGTPPVPRAYLLGLSTTLVPCGWLYAFVMAAAASGRVTTAVGSMFVFWLGTLPALIAAGIGLRQLFARLGAHARTVSSVLIVASGVLVLALRNGVPLLGSAAGEDAGSSSAEHCPLHPR
jgi:sulfite exporter TauE/SafE